MFKPLPDDLLRALEELGRRAKDGLVLAYVGEILVHRGLAEQDPKGKLTLTAHGRRVLQEHQAKGIHPKERPVRSDS